MTILQLTDRDMKVINFIKEFKMASTSTIARLFFPSKATAEKRLRKLVDNRKLFRTRETILDEYVYYIKRPTNTKHSLLIAEIYSKLMTNKDIQVIKYYREYEIKFRAKALRTDLMAVIKTKDNKLVPVIIEIDLTKKYKNKYDDYIQSRYYQQKFPVPPVIVCISNRTPQSNIPIRWFKLNEIE